MYYRLCSRIFCFPGHEPRTGRLQQCVYYIIIIIIYIYWTFIIRFTGNWRNNKILERAIAAVALLQWPRVLRHTRARVYIIYTRFAVPWPTRIHNNNNSHRSPRTTVQYINMKWPYNITTTVYKYNMLHNTLYTHNNIDSWSCTALLLPVTN